MGQSVYITFDICFRLQNSKIKTFSLRVFFINGKKQDKKEN